MSQTTVYLCPDGVEPWVIQRVHRLARQGNSPSRIASTVGIAVDQVQRYLARPMRFERCKKCRGMVLPPCKVCELRSTTGTKVISASILNNRRIVSTAIAQDCA